MSLPAAIIQDSGDVPMISYGQVATDEEYSRYPGETDDLTAKQARLFAVKLRILPCQLLTARHDPNSLTVCGLTVGHTVTLTVPELEASVFTIYQASTTSFGTLFIGPSQPRNQAVFPMIHVYLLLRARGEVHESRFPTSLQNEWMSTICYAVLAA
jgi:hypothetical protein